MLLKGKVAVVTGGTRGIGFAIVQKFLENGAKVILTGSRQDSVEKALEKLHSIDPMFSVEGAWPDSADIEAVKIFFSEIIEKYKTIDIVVNNAGISAPVDSSNFNSDIFERVIRTNYVAGANMAASVVPYMKQQGGGVILFTSSVAGIYGRADIAYSSTKFAIRGMALSMALDLGKYNIRVNTVAPGSIETDMTSALPDEVKAYICSTIPLGHIGQPEDVANAFLFLASDMAKHITGITLEVAGGGQM